MTNDDLAERIANALERIADALERMTPDSEEKANRLKYQRPLSEFPTFDWSLIGAEVLKADQWGAAIISWRGKEYYRRSNDTYGADVWFARGNGKRDDGKTNYDWLIKFSPVEDKQVKPISRTAEAKLQQLPPQLPPQPQSQPQPQPYPQHNALIKSIRGLTGHTQEQIVDWCKAQDANSPAELSPEQCKELAQALALGWGSARFPSPEQCRTSYQGKVETLLASGASLENAIASWIESVGSTSGKQ
jgi:hypothetical protein